MHSGTRLSSTVIEGPWRVRNDVDPDLDREYSLYTMLLRPRTGLECGVEFSLCMYHEDSFCVTSTCLPPIAQERGERGGMITARPSRDMSQGRTRRSTRKAAKVDMLPCSQWCGVGS